VFVFIISKDLVRARAVMGLDMYPKQTFAAVPKATEREQRREEGGRALLPRPGQKVRDYKEPSLGILADGFVTLLFRRSSPCSLRQLRELFAHGVCRIRDAPTLLCSASPRSLRSLRQPRELVPHGVCRHGCAALCCDQLALFIEDGQHGNALHAHRGRQG